jgi:hypothetical protein
MKILKIEKFIVTCGKCYLLESCKKSLNVESYVRAYGINPHCPLQEVLSPCCKAKIKKSGNKICCRNCKKEIIDFGNLYNIT